MFKYIILLLIVLLINIIVYAQKLDKKNSFDSIPQKRLKNTFQLEIGGTSLGLGLNYERTIINSDNFFINGRIGIGTGIIIWTTTYSFSCNFGKKNKYLECGFGLTNYWMKDILSGNFREKDPSYFLFPFIGYRYQKELLIKLQILYLVTHEYKLLPSFYFGLSVGKEF